jgi:hypothetical protein
MILVTPGEGASEARCEAAPEMGERGKNLDRPSKRNVRQQFVHSSSAIHPQLFHNPRRRGWRVAILLAAWLFTGVLAAAASQPSELGSIYRVFLKNGDALPSYGEAAIVGDRIVFNLSIGGVDGPLTLQLISLPASTVDLERTNRYADSMRAAFYAATRGPAEYEAMTAALSRDLDTLAATPDRRRQLAIAEDLHQRLAVWPRAHFFYRMADVEKLFALVGDVVDELKAAVGEKTFALELTAGPRVPLREALLPAPRRKEAVELSLSASEAADIGEDRIAILRAAASVAPPDDPALAAAVRRRLDEELRAGTAYSALAENVRERARTAVTRGDVPGVDRLQTEVLTRDQQLGFRRPQVVQSLVAELRAAREDAVARRETLDRYVAVRGRLLEYELAIRPALSALDGLQSVLLYVRDNRTVSFERVVAAQSRFERVLSQVQGVQPPVEASGIHATLVSAMRMAVEACLKRREAAATTAMPTVRAASAAAAGALLLGERARADLVDSLCLGGRIATCSP